MEKQKKEEDEDNENDSRDTDSEDDGAPKELLFEEHRDDECLLPAGSRDSDSDTSTVDGEVSDARVIMSQAERVATYTHC
eukprot:5870863-Ditylum_brightwellii.AAC.1